MELRHLRYFLAVADEGSFLRAAERLHVSQPPLSTQVRALERELQVRLLQRSNRGIRLTSAGEAFYTEARSVLARLEHARLAARRSAQGRSGRLGIGFVSIADYSVLPETLKRFRRQYEDVQLVLHEQTSDVQLRELAEEKIDVGFALAPVEHPKLCFEELKSERLLLAVPEAHSLACTGETASLRAVAREPFILFPRPLAPGLHDNVIAYCKLAGFAPNIAQHARQMQTIVSLVAGGLGVALVPESLRNLGRAGVAYLKPREPSPVTALGLAYRKTDGNPVLRHFLETARASTGAPMRLRGRIARAGAVG